MARTPELWQRKSDGAWYTTVHGKQIRLSDDKAEARQSLHELLAAPPDDTRGHRPSIAKACDLFLTYSHAQHEVETYKHYRWFLQSFCAHVKKGRKIADLRVHMVTSWHQANAWSESSKASSIGVLLACLNWNVAQGHLKANPFTGIKRGRIASRERILSVEERRLILEAASDPPFRQFLIFLEQTGCRPFSEAGRTTAQDFDPRASTITLKRHKNAAKTGKPRVIYLSVTAKEIVAELVSRHREGPLFRCSTDTPWSVESAGPRLDRIAASTGVAKFTSYAYRHTFIVEALMRGLTADVVAQLVGNSALTISKYYSHLDQKRDFLRAAAQQAVDPAT
jgi:integrase